MEGKRKSTQTKERKKISKSEGKKIEEKGKRNLRLVCPSPSPIMSNGKQKCQLVELIEDKSIVIIMSHLPI